MNLSKTLSLFDGLDYISIQITKLPDRENLWRNGLLNHYLLPRCGSKCGNPRHLYLKKHKFYYPGFFLLNTYFFVWP